MAVQGRIRQCLRWGPEVGLRVSCDGTPETQPGREKTQANDRLFHRSQGFDESQAAQGELRRRVRRSWTSGQSLLVMEYQAESRWEPSGMMKWLRKVPS